MMKSDNTKKTMFLVLIFGEIITVAIVIGLFLLTKTYWSKLTGGTTLKVILGASLGAIVTIANQIIMFVFAERAFDKTSKMRGTREMSEEEISEFKKDNGAALKNQMQLSFIVRTALIAVVFVLAYFTNVFDILACVIPLVMLKPLILLSEVFQKRK